MNRRQRAKLAGVPGDKPADAPDPLPADRAVLLTHVQALLSPAFVDTVLAPHQKGLRRRLLPLPLVALATPMDNLTFALGLQSLPEGP